VSNIGVKAPGSKNLIWKIPFLVFSLVYVLAFVLLYQRYVPQVRDLQLVLVPLLVFGLILTSVSLRTGTFFFIFCVPLLNSLPNFFGLIGFSPLFVLFCIYIMGVLIHQLLHPLPLSWNISLFLPILGASVVIILSALITLWRYANFFPLYSNAIYELAVNVLNVSAGEAIRRVLFDALNYLAGFLWFFLVFSILKTKEIVLKAVIILAISSSFAFTFGFLQVLVNRGLGNTDFWVAKGQINALFTDPNALGVYLALTFPLFAGAILAIQNRKQRIFLFFMLLFGTALMPHSGSRSGLLGLVLSALLVFIFAFKVSRSISDASPGKSKLIRVGLAIIVICGGVLTITVMTAKDSILYQRIFRNKEIFFKSESRDDVLNARQQLWPTGFNMVREFPLSGIGVGAFTCELPNYYIKYGTGPTRTSAINRESESPMVLIDSSGNFYLQIASEMGLIALVMFLWIFVLIIKKGLGVILKRSDGRQRFLAAGLISGILALFIMFFFGVHTLSFEIQIVFWLMVGLCYSISEREEGKTQPNKLKVILVCVGVMVFAVVHIWNSVNDLSLLSRTRKFRLIQSFGLYQKEVSDGRQFRWTKKTAAMAIKMEKPVLLLPIHASHPDLAQRPLRLKIYTTQDLFKSKDLAADIVIRDKNWQTIRLELPEKTGREFLLVFEVSRAWQPLKILGTPDPRHLGVAIGEMSFEEDPLRTRKSPPKERITQVAKLSQAEWQGPQGSNLYKVGRCWVDISLLQGDYVLKLWARGERAQDVWPYLVIWIDDEMAGETWVPSSEWKAYEFSRKMERGQHRISIVFTNDFFIAEPDGDRNLFVGELHIYRIE